MSNFMYTSVCSDSSSTISSTILSLFLSLSISSVLSFLYSLLLSFFLISTLSLPHFFSHFFLNLSHIVTFTLDCRLNLNNTLWPRAYILIILPHKQMRIRDHHTHKIAFPVTLSTHLEQFASSGYWPASLVSHAVISEERHYIDE